MHKNLSSGHQHLCKNWPLWYISITLPLQWNMGRKQAYPWNTLVSSLAKLMCSKFNERLYLKKMKLLKKTEKPLAYTRACTHVHTGVCMAPSLQALEWDQEDMQVMKEESNKQECKTKDKLHLKFWKWSSSQIENSVETFINLLEKIQDRLSGLE